VLADPIAAPWHCAFAWQDGTFVVRDLGTDLGTYKNGERVAGMVQLADGDEVVVGCTRLRVMIKPGGEPTLELQLVPRDLAFAPSRAGEFHSDPDLWARGEADLAKWPALRHANRWAARVLIVGLPLLLLWPAAREAATEPGPLSRAHASLFTGAASTLFPRQSKLAQEQGCAVCHDSFGGTPDARCAQCHEDLVQGQHPFDSKQTDTAVVTAPLPSDSCADCHQEHHGEPIAKPRAEATKELCVKCHGGTKVEERGYTTAREPVKVTRAPRAYGGYNFGHDDHAAIDCTHCHQQAGANARAASAHGAEFAAITFALCADCHRKGATKDTVPAAWRPTEGNVWPIAWHGTGNDDGDAQRRTAEQKCGPCHAPGDGAGGFGPARRETPRLATDAAAYAKDRARYEVVPRAHAEFFVAGDRDCARCHRDSARAANATVVRPFWHELHLRTSPSAPRDDSARQALSTQCKTCHGALAQASALTNAATGSYDCASAQTCGECHRAGAHGEANATLLVPTPKPARADALPANDFPHDKHMDFAHAKLAGGCLTCHDFTPTSDGAPFAVPTTTPAARSCLPCHEQHDHIAGGACRKCHDPGVDRARAYNSFLGDRPPAARAPRPRVWPTSRAFDHFSAGHAPSTKKDCGVCHQKDSAMQARTDLATVVAPTEADATCRDCHLGERQRFHWR
jgi:hypothetical protein